jgi:4-carboxymuconolactone decarboxylase
MTSDRNNSTVLQDRDRELAIIAALVALGEKGRKHFAEHVNAALNAGARRQEVVEMIGTFSQCSGSPTAMHGAAAAIKVFEIRDINGKALPGEATFEPGDAPVSEGNDARFLRAQETIQKVCPAGPAGDTYTSVARLAPHLWRNIATFFCNDIFLHPGLDLRTRELGIFANLAAMGTVPLQLKWHAHGALNNGWTGKQLNEVISELEPFVGYPIAFQAALMLQDVLDSRSGHSSEVSFEPNRSQPSLVDRAILKVQEAPPRLIATANERAFADLECGDFFSPRTSALLSLSALIAQGVAHDLLRIETKSALDSGLTEVDVHQLLKLMKKVAGRAAASLAEDAVIAAISERSKERTLKMNEPAA